MREPIIPSLTRRRLLTAMALSPLLWHAAKSKAASVDPHRIVALEWLPVELLLALGVTPYGVADVPNYKLWVNEPALPDGVIDVGLRTEPNLELLIQMNPSMIIWSTGYGPSAETLARIAPGRGFNFSDGKHPLMLAKRSLVELADLLDLGPQAQRHLAHFDETLERYAPRFKARGDRPVLMMCTMDERHVLVLGDNSLFQQVFDHWGVKNAWHGETNFWGSMVVGIERLATIKDADVICFEHGDDALYQRVAATPLWQAMPFIRQHRFQRVPAAWFYGGTLAAMHFCRIADRALGGKA
ncbi:Fe(3+)-hydroxamate ABC transporter substrate-binding protein FhuD [Siccibacter turicensis]|uniref:Fe(3+)-hydroxamate ABC transporter substrate-binding protein FhuD n=1 Tax=Siccibacter turicensis TaxID=357233 RepID=UPI00102271F7|nr:Fe(3+)-hydroxamate ABC transporter substrate-binding protein FhuD [Siccibacter turicensis]